MKKRILILGGGFGGLYTALELDRTVAGRPDVEVTLVNRENFILFTPMLHEVAASDIDLTHIVNPIRKMLKHVNFFHADVRSIDLRNKTVRVAHSAVEHVHDLEYDQLVIALGCTTNFFKLPGLEETAFTMKSLGDAIRVRNHLIEGLEAADFECAAGQSRSVCSRWWWRAADSRASKPSPASTISCTAPLAITSICSEIRFVL